MSEMKTWFCKIGEIEHQKIRNGNVSQHGPDGDMRRAVAEAYRRMTGEEETFIFSGWGDELDEKDRAVVEDREPDYFKTEWLEHRLHGVRVQLRADQPLPEWSDQQWATTVMMKLGEAAYWLGYEGNEDKPEKMRRLGIDCLMATAAACLDAVEAMEGVKPDAET